MCTGEQPTVIELIRFHGRKGTINILQQISTKYTEFGIFLLEDSNGVRVRNLELKHLKNADEINTEIVQEWIAGRGKKPVTWGTFIEVLHDMNLATVADEIKAIKSPSLSLTSRN